MQLVRLIVSVAALIGAAISLGIFVSSFTGAAFITNTPIAPYSSDAGLSSTSTPSIPHSQTGLPPLLIGGMIFLAILTALTYLTMPAPWYQKRLFGLFRRRINWVLNAANFIGGVILIVMVVTTMRPLASGEHPGRYGEGYAIYNQGVMVREIDKSEADRMMQEQRQSVDTMLWRAFSAFVTINLLAIAGYGVWYILTRPQTAPSTRAPYPGPFSPY